MPTSPILVSLQQITAETVRSARFQGQGIGKVALLRVVEHVRSKGLLETLELSYVPRPGCPEPFYIGIGFRHTGRVDGNEIVLEYPLHESAT